MARRQIVTLEDDIQGGVATETLRFAFDGDEYEIDLNDKNAGKMRQALAIYVDHGREVSGARRQSSRRRTGRASAGVDNRAVRAWAASNGVELAARGRIPAAVIDQYRAAGN